MTKQMKVSDVIGTSKKKAFRTARFNFKCDEFSTEVEVKTERMNSKKILPYEEYEQDKQGRRVVKKLVGYNRGEAKYFLARQNEKGKWVADYDKPAEGDVEKVVLDTRTGKVAKKDTLKGLWFSKCVREGVLSEWLIEDTYTLWTEDNCDQTLKVYQYLKDNNLVGVYKYNPNGTAYNAFLVPQAVDGVHFRLLLQVARVKTNKPDIAPTMTIQGARERESEKNRIAQDGVMSALEEV